VSCIEDEVLIKALVMACAFFVTHTYSMWRAVTYLCRLPERDTLILLLGVTSGIFRVTGVMMGSTDSGKKRPNESPVLCLRLHSPSA
jgi:hypothetical protein